MLTYAEHYEKCCQIYEGQCDYSRYKSVYDLTVDNNLLHLDKNYYNVVDKVSKKISYKFDNNIGTFGDDFALRLNDWRDVEEISMLADIVMPQIEEKVFHSNLAVEFIHTYRNRHSVVPPESSWKWHYDDCPKEFIKLFVYLNDVNEDNGCMQVLKQPNNSFKIIESSRIGPQNGGSPQIPQKYKGSRIPEHVIQETVNSGGAVVNLTGAQGDYALLTPNIPHRATTPKKETVPRDIMVFYIRPSLLNRKYISEHTYSYFPKRNVKLYHLN